jgi:hypothetical protein
MARIFGEDFYSLPLVGVLDWELWERLGSLIEPHVPSDYGLPLYFATDSRGQYDTASLDALRAEVDQHDGAPETIRLTLSVGGEPGLFFNVYASDFIGTGGRVQSQDEALVNHLAARVYDLYAEATKRRPAQPPSVRDEPQSESTNRLNREKVRAFFDNKWVLSVGAPLLVVAILAVIGVLVH